MNANGQRFWLISEKAHWRLLDEPSGLEYDTARRSLRLASQRREMTFIDQESIASDRLQLIPQTLDSHGNRAYWDSEAGSVIATGALDDEVIIYSPAPALGDPTDLAMGYDGVLYIAIGGHVRMHDRRERWDDTTVSSEGFTAWRMAADPQGGVWVLDRDSRRLARVCGQPLPKRPFSPYQPGVFRPCRENAHPPRLTVFDSIIWPEAEKPMALACSPGGNIAILSWFESGNAGVRSVNSRGSLTSSTELLGAAHPYSLRWVSEDRVAVLLAGVTKESPVYKIDSEQKSQWPVGDLYPLKKDYNGGPFLHCLDFPPHYPAAEKSRALHRLSFPFFTKQGKAVHNRLTAPMDSGDPQTVWHRLYIEAVIPTGCGIKIWLAATDNAADHLSIDTNDRHEHRFGKVFEQGARSDIPLGVWEVFPSELPHERGLLPCEAERDISGLFSILVQRSGMKVRSLSGRYFHVLVELIGNGQATPEIFALRVYGSRFSYVNEYLPRLYRESTFAPEADEEGTATGPDFLERFIGNMEGVLTNMEDRIAHSYLLTHPATVPCESLEWLAGWIGFDFDSAVPEIQKRKYLQSAPELYRWYGTLRGLKLSLELATGGGVSGGEIVVLEDFRLRRTFATIIGADLADEDDPLTAGGAVSGNSYVGDTLFTGDENRKEFLALFSADLPTDTSEQSAIDALFDKLANRVTILVHEAVIPQDLGLIQSVSEREVPAHVEFRVLTATSPFLVGMASLVGIDTYLAEKIPAKPARIGESHVGRSDFVQGPAALDPRLEGVGSGVPRRPSKRPVASAPDVTAEHGENVTLDGSESRAFEGRALTRYNWKFREKED